MKPFAKSSSTLLSDTQKWTLAILLLFVPLFEPGSVSGVSWLAWLNPVFGTGKVLSMLIVLLIIIRKGKCDRFIAAVIIFTGALLAASIYNGEGVSYWVRSYSPYIASCFIVAVFRKDHPLPLLRAIFILTFALSCTNFLSVLVFPHGMYHTAGSLTNDSYFWRHKNGIYAIIIPSVITSGILDCLSNRRFGLLTAAALLIGLAQSVLAYSATTLYVLVLLTLGLLLIGSKLGRRLLNSLAYVAAYLIGYFGIVVFRVQMGFPLLFENLIGRSATFTGRTVIWNLVFLYMDQEHMLLGYGLSNTVLQQYSASYASAHNLLLSIWFMGGIISLAGFSLVLLLACWNLYKTRTHLVAALISLAAGCFLFVGLTEHSLSVSMVIILALGFYVNDIIPKGILQNSPRGIHRSNLKRIPSGGRLN